MRLSIPISLVALALAACGPTTKPEPSEPAGHEHGDGDADHDHDHDHDFGPGARPVAGGDALWKDMSKQQRIDFMKHNVLPTMRAAFQELDGEKYDRFDCTNCHGDGALDGTYEMPNPELPKLDFSPDVWPEFKQKHAAAIDFMKDTVSPQMADLLGVPRYSEDNPDGFGCMTCHPGAK